MQVAFGSVKQISILALICGVVAVSGAIVPTSGQPQSQPETPTRRPSPTRAPQPTQPAHREGGQPARPAVESSQPLPRPPKADATDQSAIDAVKRLYDELSCLDGETRNWDDFKGLFADKATLSRIIPSGQDNSKIVSQSIDDYVKGQLNLGENPYDQHGLSFRVERFGNQAHVWSAYEIIGVKDPPGRLIGRGIASVQLVRSNGAWLIYSLVLQPELKSTPLPEQYIDVPATPAQAEPATELPSPR